MLKLTKKADYGLIALRHLAVGGRTGTASAKEIADAYGIPLPLLAKILQKLTKTGLLVSVSGSSGGYKLARRPEKISALEVIHAIDRSEEHTSELQSHVNLVCRLLLEKKNAVEQRAFRASAASQR